MKGLHLIGDLHDCQCPATRLTAADQLRDFCLAACQRHGLTVVGELFHTFKNAHGQSGGVTGAIVLAESHLAIHTWPELHAVTLDLYVCNFSRDHGPEAEALFSEVCTHFSAQTPLVERVMRGDLVGKEPPYSNR